MRRFILALCALSLILAGTARGFSSYPTINETATWLANGRNVSVRCLTKKEAAEDWLIISGAAAYVEGYYDRHARWHPFPYSVFDHGICEPLQQFALGGEPKVDDLAWGILVLTHESGHLRGHRWSEDEALTERWALRHFRYTAMHLGASPEYASQLLRFAVRYHRRLPPEYRTAECRKPSVDAAGLLRGCD